MYFTLQFKEIVDWWHKIIFFLRTNKKPGRCDKWAQGRHARAKRASTRVPQPEMYPHIAARLIHFFVSRRSLPRCLLIRDGFQDDISRIAVLRPWFCFVFLNNIWHVFTFFKKITLFSHQNIDMKARVLISFHCSVSSVKNSVQCSGGTQ